LQPDQLSGGGAGMDRGLWRRFHLGTLVSTSDHALILNQRNELENTKSERDFRHWYHPTRAIRGYVRQMPLSVREGLLGRNSSQAKPSGKSIVTGIRANLS